MKPKLAPEARYRLIPHPSGVGYMSAILDEAAPLDTMRRDALTAWLAGPLHDVEARGGNRYTADGFHLAVTSEQAELLSRPMVSTLVASIGVRPFPSVPHGSMDRIFGLAADGTLIVAVACCGPTINREMAA